MFLEFLSVILVASNLIVLMLFDTKIETFESRLSNYLANTQLWIMRLEKAASGPDSTQYMPRPMYNDINICMEQAFRHDHNLIIEQADFYQ